ncbi:Nramp family divalent metal transporter [Derxia gummosa]|uniref:Divalent metal cation transporter MntH n=1 Tax=Derxia gummosa DSM 723 TaxID=1121388 RepID=A0A8B6XD96_9BURK|nr:Nramp family divalent metal transporter [Derxia gummosa]
MSPPPDDGIAATADAAGFGPSLAEVNRSVAVPSGVPVWRRALAFAGPGALVSIGYMDPGNWATGIAAGARHGYSLLWVVLLSSLMAVVLQVLAARLGIATGRDLAQLTRERASSRSAVAQWLLCELAICACDLAEVLGTAIALNLLFGLPLAAGVLLSALDTFLLLWLQQHGFRRLEAFIATLALLVFGCMGINLMLARPEVSAVLGGLLPQPLAFDADQLWLAIGIVGATVMPHNLYLHSAIVQTRRHGRDDAGKREAARFAAWDAGFALAFAFMVNAALLVLAASVFHDGGHPEVDGIEQAHELLSPLLGSALASVVFGLALLLSGQSSVVTATLAGQVVMEGFVRMRLRPWARRLLTRGIAIVPALFVALDGSPGATGRLLVLSQVLLSLQLPFAIWPLLRFTHDRRLMGALANPRWLSALTALIGALIVTLNLWMLGRMAADWLGG